MAEAMYMTKLGCDNCGHIDFYELPVRTRIEDFEAEDANQSTYGRLNGEDKHYLICKYCKLACMKVFWWDESERPVKSEAKSA